MFGRRGERAPVAIVMGTDPAVGHCSVTNLPYGVDELAVAGGLRGAPVDECESHDLVVPASAEIVIERWVTTISFPRDHSANTPAIWAPPRSPTGLT